MTSVGVFIPNGRSMERFVKRLTEEDDLGEIRIEAGSDTTASRAVWYSVCLADNVYELKEVKGMEFQVVLFYDLDEALQGDDKDLMNRYLYVGISRVTGHWQLTSSHLAAILSTEKGNEDILKYFNRTEKDWK